MIDGVSQIFGIGILILVLSYISFNLNDRHKYLKVLLLSMVFLGMIGIPKYMLDNKDYCEILVSGTNTTITDYTTYDYERICFTNPYDSANTTFIIVVWACSLFILYMVLALIWEIFKPKFDELMQKKRGKK